MKRLNPILALSFMVALAIAFQSSAAAQQPAAAAGMALSGARVGVEYSHTLRAEGGLAPLTWRVAEPGSLPPGLTLEPDGRLHGTPTSPQATPYVVDVEVTDSSVPPQRAQQQFLILVEAAPLRIVAPQQGLRILPTSSAPTAAPMYRDVVTSAQSVTQGVSAPAAAPASQLTIFPKCLVAGSMVVEGRADASVQLLDVYVLGRDETFAPSMKPVATARVGQDGAFTATLRTPLKAQQFVAIRQNGTDQVLTETVGSPLLPPQIDPLSTVEGSRIVTGTNVQKGATLEVYVHDTPNLIPQDDEDNEPSLLLLATKVEIVEEGPYEANLTAPLRAGQFVSVRQVENGQSSLVRTSGPVRSSDFDWGRVRAYFSSYGIFSQGNEDFSEEDLGLGFNFDANWYNSRRVTFNTFLDVRLTAIPVPIEMPPMTSTTGTTGTASRRGKARTPWARQNGNGTGDPDPADPVSDVLGSKKAVLMQLGGYLPTMWDPMIWKHKGEDNALFFGPIAKVGIQTLVDDATDTEVARTTAFWSVGARIGHYKLAPLPLTFVEDLEETFNSNRADRETERTELRRKIRTSYDESAHELISYLDITVGQFGNFRGFGEGENFNENGRTRMMFEGRLKIPETPLMVGFDASLGDVENDLRFVVGTRFDFGKLLRNLRFLGE